MDELIKLLDKRDIRQISKDLYIKNLNTCKVYVKYTMFFNY